MIGMKRRKTTRRDFLKGRSAVDAISDVADGRSAAEPVGTAGDAPSAEAPAQPTREGSYLVEVGRSAMACQFDVFLNAGQHAGATEAALAALDLVDTIEDQLTVYRDYSEVSRLNQMAAEQPVVVAQNLFRLFEESLELYRSTAGCFDITSGPLSKVWGFYRRSGCFPPRGEIGQALQRVGSRWLELDAGKSTVRFARRGMEINFNALGKGYALDCCAEHLQERGVQDFLIHGGHSSMLARGSRLSGGPPQGWQVALRHPLIPGERLAEVHLRDRALGTSGSGNQFFHHQGRRFGHILDPRTGKSVEGILSATVVTASALKADALATAFFVMGVERSLEYCQRSGDLSAILVSPGRRSGSLKLHTIGLADEDWKRLAD
jgi:thiamine biosynthesis lipoprotein